MTGGHLLARFQWASRYGGTSIPRPPRGRQLVFSPPAAARVSQPPGTELSQQKHPSCQLPVVGPRFRSTRERATTSPKKYLRFSCTVQLLRSSKVDVDGKPSLTKENLPIRPPPRALFPLLLLRSESDSLLQTHLHQNTHTPNQTNTMSLSVRFAAQCAARQLRASTRASSSLLVQKRFESTAAAPAVNPKISAIVDQISTLTLLETSELVASLKVRPS